MAVDLMTWLGQVAAQVAHLWKYAARKADVPTYAWATVATVGPPATVILEHDESGSPRAVSANSVGYLEVGWRVRVERVQNKLTIIAAPDDRSVHYTATNRHITIGPDGDFEPILELARVRPSYLAGALMYLAVSGSTTELAWALQDNGVNQATLRLTKDGLRLQNNVTGITRYFAYQDDVTALQAATADTGWLSLTLASGFTGTCFYRVKNGYVSFKGRVTRTAGAWPNSYTTIANLPAAAQSPDAFYAMGMSRYSPLPYAIGSAISVTSGGAASPNSEFELRSIAPFTA